MAFRTISRIALALAIGQTTLHAADRATDAGGAWRDQFKPRLGVPVPAPTPKVKQNVTYTLQQDKERSEEQVAAYKAIADGMNKAVACYNEHATGIKVHVNVSYNPGVPTADGSSNGSIRLGKYSRNQRVCMHELAHTLGIGTSAQWSKLVQNGVFTGKQATECIRQISGDKEAVLHADRMHFWPYGLNYDGEVKSSADFVNHCKLVSAICADLKRARD